MNKILMVLLIAPFIFGCSDKQKAMKELKALCEKDAGFKLYESVVANGYFHGFLTGGL